MGKFGLSHQVWWIIIIKFGSIFHFHFHFEFFSFYFIFQFNFKFDFGFFFCSVKKPLPAKWNIVIGSMEKVCRKVKKFAAGERERGGGPGGAKDAANRVRLEERESACVCVFVWVWQRRKTKRQSERIRPINVERFIWKSVEKCRERQDRESNRTSWVR